MSIVEVVETASEARGLGFPPLLVLDPLREYLDANGVGRGPLRPARVGDGHSNVTYLIERDDDRFVLRRPPRPPLPPTAHDMLREARIVRALERAGARVPHVRLVCDDESVLGVPFYVMDVLDGMILGDSLPAALAPDAERRRIGPEVVDALAEVHAIDWRACGLEGLGRPSGYLERQIRRFSGLWEVNATRDLPRFADLAGWLEANRPESGPATLVHGEYRLGNVMFSRTAPVRVIAVLDWELSTIGDPLADLGYLIANWTDPASARTPLELSTVTGLPGFSGRAELAERYEERTGRSVRGLPWYEALAHWKAAVFCEAIYGRWLRGERPRDDPFAGGLEAGVPRFLEVAGECAARI